VTQATRPTPLVVLDVVGLTPRLLRYMPRLQALAGEGFTARLDPVLPAVTCSVQASLLTGLTPREHGIVGNGWYFRDLGEVYFWRQHNRLVGGEKVWEAARGRFPAYRAANLCWWYAMGASTDITLTPRPIYHADGRKSPDCYTVPAELHDQLTAELGPFPLFHYWGPTASIASSRWIVAAASRVLAAPGGQPDLTLVYVPHLDYDLQRYGPDGPQAVAAARAVDAVIEPLLADSRERGATVVVVSEYGITGVRRPIEVNRVLRREGLLAVYAQAGMEYLDPWISRAFAVADHQVAHVYVRDPADVSRVRSLLAEVPGVAEVLDDVGKPAYGLDHERSGELVAVAAPDAWFTYHYWLDDERAPDFARTVEIHRKPGYDPSELLFDPADRLVRLRAGAALVRKRLGLRYTMPVVPLDPSYVKGSHGRLPDTVDAAPLLICSDPSVGRERFAATEIKDLFLRLAGLAPAGARAAAQR
jgi:predicted AlkP superfamily pyrophosphatase or phosphodiesterase